MPDINFKFEDYSATVLSKLDECCESFLEEAGGEIETAAKRNSRVKTGKTKGSFTHVVDKGAQRVDIGSPDENAIWEEFGTGIYALNGNGRKDVPWKYKDPSDKWWKTSGKKGTRALFNAFEQTKGMIERIAQERFGGMK